MRLEKRELIQGEVERMHQRTGIAVTVLAGYAGVSRSTWQEWQNRRGEATRHNGNLPKRHWLTPDEQGAIIAYCRERLEQGYRRLTYQMLDANIVAVSCSAVYTTLKRAGLTKRRAVTGEEAGKGFIQPERVHEQWHTDFSYLKIGGIFYYFAAVLDGFSRMILAWDIFMTMETWTVQTVVQKAKEQYPAARPRLITDNGSQFISKDFKELMALLEIHHTFIRPAHPQSNGKLERFHRTLKSEEVRMSAYLGYEDARLRVGEWIGYYNEVRLHSGIYYLTPKEVFEGKTEERLAERRERLHTAYINRRAFWETHEACSTLYTALAMKMTGIYGQK
jgi:transposase InsO family protein